MNEREFEDLVEAALDPSVADSSGAQDGELRRLRDFAARARRAALEPVASTDAWSEMRESALVGRILGRTTREDLSWRGELRIVASFVRERLSASPLLRFVAASLALHLAAVPVLAAWYVYDRDEPPGLQISIEPAVTDSPFDDEHEEFDTPVVMSDDTLDAPASDEIENATRRARFVLSRAFTPGVERVVVAESSGDPTVALERNLLEARSRLLAERAWSDWLDETERWTDATTLARVLWVETLLDRLALEGVRSPRLGPFLNDLSLASTTGGEASAALAALIDLSLDRARSYGAWAAAADFEPSAVPLPLSAAWFDALERAASSTALIGDPAWDSFQTWTR